MCAPDPIFGPKRGASPNHDCEMVEYQRSRIKQTITGEVRWIEANSRVGLGRALEIVSELPAKLGTILL
jgi:hypothetical protein